MGQFAGPWVTRWYLELLPKQVLRLACLVKDTEAQGQLNRKVTRFWRCRVSLRPRFSESIFFGHFEDRSGLVG